MNAYEMVYELLPTMSQTEREALRARIDELGPPSLGQATAVTPKRFGFVWYRHVTHLNSSDAGRGAHVAVGQYVKVANLLSLPVGAVVLAGKREQDGTSKFEVVVRDGNASNSLVMGSMLHGFRAAGTRASLPAALQKAEGTPFEDTLRLLVGAGLPIQ